MHEDNSIWAQKGATLSDKSAQQEFGLIQQEIIAAMRAGKLQFREGSIYGNPWFRLLRHEVEALVSEKRGRDHLQKKKYQKELSDINKDIKKLKAQLAALEQRRGILTKALSGGDATGERPKRQGRMKGTTRKSKRG